MYFCCYSKNNDSAKAQRRKINNMVIPRLCSSTTFQCSLRSRVSKKSDIIPDLEMGLSFYKERISDEQTLNFPPVLKKGDKSFDAEFTKKHFKDMPVLKLPSMEPTATSVGSFIIEFGDLTNQVKHESLNIEGRVLSFCGDKVSSEEFVFENNISGNLQSY